MKSNALSFAILLSIHTASIFAAVPNIFSFGQVISSQKMNENFDFLATKVADAESDLLDTIAQLSLRVPLLITTSTSLSIPPGAIKVQIEVTGGSGGGGGRVDGAGGSDGGYGGSGGYLKILRSAPAGGNIVITIGGGGTAGSDVDSTSSCSSVSGGSGSDSVVLVRNAANVTLSTLIAKGGDGGSGVSCTGNAPNCMTCGSGYPGKGGNSYGGTFNLAGASGSGGAGSQVAGPLPSEAGAPGQVIVTFY